MGILRFKKPMLAKSFDATRIEYPCYVQPKLDGIRCITDGQRFWSRNGKEFPIWNTHHLKKDRLKFLVDGEFMVNEGADFEDLVSMVKRNKHPNCEDIQFNAFDIMTKESYQWRLKRLRNLFQDMLGRGELFGWRIVPTRVASSIGTIQAAHRRNLLDGFEGSMIRDRHGLYVSTRTWDLMKYKPLLDSEFTIVDVKEGRGKDAGTPIYICVAKGRKFAARPMGTMKQRRAMWRHRKRDIGKLLTVEYQNLTKYGVPRFPRAKVLRDYE